MATSITRLANLIAERIDAQHAALDQLMAQQALDPALDVIAFMLNHLQDASNKIQDCKNSLCMGTAAEIHKQQVLLATLLLWQGGGEVTFPTSQGESTGDQKKVMITEADTALEKLKDQLARVRQRESEVKALKTKRTSTEMEAAAEVLKTNKAVDFTLFTTEIAPNIRDYVNSYLTSSKETLLHLAVAAEREDIAVWLRANGANVLACTNHYVARFAFSSVPVTFSAHGVSQLLPTAAEWTAFSAREGEVSHRQLYTKYNQQFVEKCEFALRGNHTELAQGLFANALCPVSKISDQPNGYQKMELLPWLSAQPAHFKILEAYLQNLKQFNLMSRFWEESSLVISCDGIQTNAFGAAILRGNTQAVRLLTTEHSAKEKEIFALTPQYRPKNWAGVLPMTSVAMPAAADKSVKVVDTSICTTILEREIMISDAHWEIACDLIKLMPSMVPAEITKYATGSASKVYLFPKECYADNELGLLKKRIHLATFLHFTRALMHAERSDFNRAEIFFTAAIAAPNLETVWSLLSQLMSEVIRTPMETPNAFRTTLVRMLRLGFPEFDAVLGDRAKVFNTGEKNGFKGMALYALAMFLKIQKVHYFQDLPPASVNLRTQLALQLQQLLKNATCDYFMKNFHDAERLKKFSEVEKTWSSWAQCEASLEKLLPFLISFLNEGYGLRLESHRWCVVAAILNHEGVRTALGLSPTSVSLDDQNMRKSVLKTVLEALQRFANGRGLANVDIISNNNNDGAGKAAPGPGVN